MSYPLSQRKLKLVRSLKEKKARKEREMYLAEGFSLTEDAIRYPRSVELMVVLESVAGSKKAVELIDKAENKGIPVFLSSQKDFRTIMTTTTSPGIVLVVRKKLDLARKRMKQMIEAPSALVVYLDGLQDPGNVGTIIRTADALGADAVISGSKTAEIYNPKTVRATMGSVLWFPAMEVGDMGIGLRNLIDNGFTAIATTVDNSKGEIQSALARSAVLLWDIKPAEKTVLIFGNEARGISQDILSHCSLAVKVPMRGHIESLNVAIAAGITIRFETKK